MDTNPHLQSCLSADAYVAGVSFFSIRVTWIYACSFDAPSVARAFLPCHILVLTRPLQKSDTMDAYSVKSMRVCWTVHIDPRQSEFYVLSTATVYAFHTVYLGAARVHPLRPQCLSACTEAPASLRLSFMHSVAVNARGGRNT